MYLALYRKYRPRNFDEVIGQDHIIRTLENQIKADKIGHAYLFCGSRGTGKTSTAKIFARAINCQHPKNGSPCGECDVCKALSGNNIDIMEIDAASNNGVDEIRDLREKVKYPPVNGKYKVYIVDEVHMLTANAFNALLKTLEEPPAYAVFILATTEVHKLPATILSRCLRFDFKLVSTAELGALVKKVFKAEGISAEDEAIEIIAHAGDGSVRDTLSVADRCVSYAGGNVTYKSVVEVLGTTEKDSLATIASHMLSGDLGKSLKELDTLLAEGKSPLVLSRDLIAYFRDLLIIASLKEDAKKMVVASEDVMKKMTAQATDENWGKITAAINNLSEVEAELRYSVSPRIVLETAIIKTLTSLNLIERVERLEKALASGVVPPVASPAVAAQPKAPEASQVESVSAPASAPAQDNSELLGKLLSYLRERKDMSLLSCMRQVKRVELDGNKATFLFDDQMAVDMVSRDKYRSTFNEFFSTINMEYSFKAESSLGRGDEGALSRAFDGRLNIRG